MNDSNFRILQVGDMAERACQPFRFRPPEGSGHVYAVEFSCGYVKVGITTNPGERLRNLHIDIVSQFGAEVLGSPVTGRAVVSGYCDNFRAVEKQIHRAMSSLHVQGEYFRGDIDTAMNAFKDVDFSWIAPGYGRELHRTRTVKLCPERLKQIKTLAIERDISASAMAEIVIDAGLEVFKEEIESLNALWSTGL